MTNPLNIIFDDFGILYFILSMLYVKLHSLTTKLMVNIWK